ncbi:ATP-binding cassette domain-containing protein [Caldibacillus debilis]|uniref:ATP-binding cassette domain-containing protein n=1 Tax=Caldibacillus debilis TaxID=301148 RepID=UPI00217DD66B|nr:ATP-binding cassette domain-containing protein [Caldibacillus debilis]
MTCRRLRPSEKEDEKELKKSSKTNLNFRILCPIDGARKFTFFRKLYTKPTADPVELLKLVGLADAADVRLSHFSKGMKMRLNFCRALLNHPKILFLDEPTSGLDPVNARNKKI